MGVQNSIFIIHEAHPYVRVAACKFMQFPQLRPLVSVLASEEGEYGFAIVLCSGTNLRVDRPFEHRITLEPGVWVEQIESFAKVDDER
jgi:hypothetical protein